MRRRVIVAACVLAGLAVFVLLVTVGQLRWLQARHGLRGCDELAAEGHAEDGVPPGDAEALAHLAATFTVAGGGAPASALELICRELHHPADAIPPDPGPMLRAMSAANPDSRPGAIPLRVMTWNVALLDVWLGPVHYAESPFRQQRRPHLFDQVLSLDPPPDILLLQEAWLREDTDALVEQAAAHGYAAATWQGRSEGRRERRGDVGGLMTLVRRELVGLDPGQHLADQQVTAVAAGVQLADERAWLPAKDRFSRGWLQVRFEHELLGPVSVFNTHLHPYLQNWRWRRQASRELGLAARAAREAGDLVFVGGDVNAAPWYADDVWQLPAALGGEALDVGFENGIGYAALLHYGGLADLAVRGWRQRPDRDVVVGRSARNDADWYDRELFGPDGQTLKEPFHACIEAARAGRAACGDQQPPTFTATECNGLFMKQYAGTEPPARLDHLLAADPDGRIHVLATEVVLTDPEAVDVGDCRVEASDHYGLLVDLYVAPPLDWRR